ncbi:MAG: DUF2851 family protein [Chloroflexi bacterium]|nr:DUF2851 family protein [Chloroflexota bacterium]
MATYPMGTGQAPLRLIAEDEREIIPERLLAKFWKERAARLSVLRTEAGRRVRVVYPGRAGVTAGPDFRDALLEVEGVGFVHGDVELHIKQKDWNAHGHGRDPNYNGVVFHGALEVHSEETRLQSGALAPVIDLSALLAEAPAAISAENSETAPLIDLWQVLAKRGFPRPKTSEEMEETLDRVGDLRFKWKSGWLFQCIQAEGPDQALYQGLMEGLGYRSNQRPFVELASVAPYQKLAKAAWQLPPESRHSAISNWLMDRSGLGFPEPLCQTGREADQLSEDCLPKGLGSAMNKKEWRLFRVRPSNHPRRRIMGAAALLNRFLGLGLAVGLREVVQRESTSKLTAGLCVDGDSGPAYVGRGRAKDLAVNVVLPFMHAWDAWQAREVGRDSVSDADAPGIPETLYSRYPLLAANEITREMTAQLLPVGWQGAVSTARRQQGLLHLSEVLKGAF